MKDDCHVYTYEEWIERHSDILVNAIVITHEAAMAICKAHGHSWEKVGSFYRCRMCREWKEARP